MKGDDEALRRERERIRRLFNAAALIFPLFEGRLSQSYSNALAALALPTHLTVLDLGTGSGALAAAFAARGHPVTGYDTAERLLRRAARRLPGASFERKDLVELPALAAGSFDLVSLAHVLHGVPPVLRHLALTQARRIARQAVVIIDYLGKLPWHIRCLEWLEGPHYRSYAAAPLPGLAAAAGLRVVREVPLPPASACWLLAAGPQLHLASLP